MQAFTVNENIVEAVLAEKMIPASMGRRLIAELRAGREVNESDVEVVRAALEICHLRADIEDQYTAIGQEEAAANVSLVEFAQALELGNPELKLVVSRLEGRSWHNARKTFRKDVVTHANAEQVIKTAKVLRGLWNNSASPARKNQPAKASRPRQTSTRIRANRQMAHA